MSNEKLEAAIKIKELFPKVSLPRDAVKNFQEFQSVYKNVLENKSKSNQSIIRRPSKTKSISVQIANMASERAIIVPKILPTKQQSHKNLPTTTSEFVRKLNNMESILKSSTSKDDISLTEKQLKEIQRHLDRLKMISKDVGKKKLVNKRKAFTTLDVMNDKLNKLQEKYFKQTKYDYKSIRDYLKDCSSEKKFIDKTKTNNNDKEMNEIVEQQVDMSKIETFQKQINKFRCVRREVDEVEHFYNILYNSSSNSGSDSSIDNNCNEIEECLLRKSKEIAKFTNQPQSESITTSNRQTMLFDNNKDQLRESVMRSNYLQHEFNIALNNFSQL